ncbi:MULTISPECIES: carboxylesterase/lipase family protein [unclassified Pseudofrankia]|uniref:carboxylesterase/lipase family protein n=1 Tax=unclassified Pseudofrankia TaxID=2994372 RepID=UPI0008D91EF2|nr:MULTISPECIES: carboxylesterase family protein [unclassified Pseudofrankia]MDT3445051.1 carboxylesterase family protein [Pseudofrankia sp. BMG5.37]OHV47189.1 carboxylesterase [Pseudofrankia sp. BMG5.36]
MIAPPATTMARTPWGDARGVDLGAVRVWRGLPYAAAPVGPARFRPPRPPEPWAGERDCSAFGPTSPQLRLPGLRGPGRRARAPRGSEDCLYLNVWSPEPGPGGQQRPVLVWIHGGGFVSGAGSSFDGARLAARGDAVVITINYRLGPWGHLDLAPDEPAPGNEPRGVNLALLDQIAALRWVRDAVGAFGGDPGRVTVFGESAGAIYIGGLLAAPAARGLFHRAVLQSGAAHHVRGLAAAQAVRRRLVEHLGRPPAEASTADLVRAGEALLVTSNDPFLQTVDGVVLPEPPMEAIAGGSCRDVPLLVTWCRDEMELFLTLAPDVVPAAEEARVRAALGGDQWRRLLARYAEDHGARARSALLTDAAFAMPAARLADAAHAAGGRVWMLRFDHLDHLGDHVRVPHGADLPLTWGRADAASPDPARRAAALWQDALLAFARAGDPATPGLPLWPRHDPDRRPVLLLTTSPRVVDRPGERRDAAWTGLPLP